MSPLRFILFLGLLGVSLTASAQDYLVTNRTDTLRGEIKLLTFGQMDQVQIVIEKKKKVYSPMEVKSLFIKGEFYKPLTHDNSIRFMKVLKAGYLSYYAFRLPNQTLYDGRYLAKMDGQGIEAPNLGFKKVITRFLEDCPEVTTKIKAEELKRSDIEKIIDEYNECIEKKTQSSQQANIAQKTGNVKLNAIKKLQAKVEAQETLNGKKDVTDLLADISDKISRHQTIPNYQLEALKGLLKDNEQTKEELEKVIVVLSEN
ncbi:MAG TPA: hypothetical protein VIT44_00555 [Cyclobacteriaceae bacterium]